MFRFSSASRRATTPAAGRISRRGVLKGIAAGAGALALGDLAVPFFTAPTVSQAAPIPREQLRIGATFSPLEARYMEIDEREMLEGILSLNLDFIRLGAYWNELEQRDGVFEFERLDWMLELCEQRNVPVILTIGVKAPVWPEFHIPWWVWESTWLPPTGLLTRSERLVELGHRFTRTVAERYAATRIVTVLQVENEPYEPVLTERVWSLDEPFLRRQVAIVREADRLNRPILLTAYVASYRILAGLQGMLSRPTGAALFDLVLGQRPLSGFIEMADIIGLDTYPAIGWQFFGWPTYLRAESDDDYLPLLAFRDAALAASKQVMIAECQAKPWEPGEKVYRYTDTPSFRPTDIAPLVARLADYGFPEIALWGVEHWYWHRENGDRAWWEHGARLLADRAQIVSA